MKGFFFPLVYFLSGICLAPAFCLGSPETAVSDPARIDLLNSYLQNAQNLEAKNLNRFAMEVLYQYNKKFDSLALAEKTDTLAKIVSQYEKDTRTKRLLSDSLDVLVKKYSGEKEELRVKYFGLLRKAVIALIIWLAIVAVILTLRTKAMKKNKLLQSESEAALATYQSLFTHGESMLKLSTNVTPVEAQISGAYQALLSFQEDIRKQIKSGALDTVQSREIQNKTNEILSLCEKQDSILQAVRTQREAESEGKTEADINSLCKHYLDLATCGMDKSLLYIVTTDFEKRLPKIKIFPQAIGTMLNNLFANSFQSMLARAATGGKTYKPALTVSTRVLPRFIQIRIKDNGTGIQDEELEAVFGAFYSLHPPERGAGLGLAEARRIMKEMHNGEITIESDPERGTDVYLKFFTGNEKA